jgi:hypothetical protein
MPAWVYFLAFAGLAAFCASMFMIPKERAFMITGFVVVGAGWLGGVYYNIRIIIVAFMESVACGLLSLFIPLYILYYIFTRWDRCGGFFLMSLVMGAVSGLGWIFVAAAPLMADKEESAAWLLVPPAWVVEADEDIMGRIRV